MNPDACIIVFSPVILDLNIKSPLSNAEYHAFLTSMLVNEGDWVEVHDFDKFRTIVERVSMKSLTEVLDSQDSEIGATTLASLTAFNEQYKYNFKIVVFAGENSSQINTIFFNLLKQKFKKYEIIKCKGNSAICLISFTAKNPERTMFLYKDLHLGVRENFASYSNSLILISAFEIFADFFIFNIELLYRKNIFFAINLGDKDVLNPSTINVIYLLLSNNRIKYIFGSIVEFSVLTTTSTDKGVGIVFSKVRELSLLCDAVFFITSDAGVQVFYNGNFYFEPSVFVSGIVNTNGAGDVAAGGFMSSHIKTNDFNYSLKFSLTQVGKVLKTSSGLI